MARSGLFKADIKKARDSLLAQNKHPSVDAVRIALGNTGSKTTIHKYLRELEEEDGNVTGRQVSLSAALQDLVSRLAAQLQEEAQVQIAEIQAQSTEKQRQSMQQLAVLEQRVAELDAQVQQASAASALDAQAHAQTRELLQKETLARHTAEQQVIHLKERLAEQENYRLSLEEKHQHARNALEHYRDSVKQQREQEQRRHEQQLQHWQAELRQLQQGLIVKQEEVTRLTQERARLVTELAFTRNSLTEQQSLQHKLEQKLEALQDTEQRYQTLTLQLADKTTAFQELKDQLAVSNQHMQALNEQVRDLQINLAASDAKLGLQQTLAAQLQAYVEESRQARATQPPDSKPDASS